MLAKLSFRLNTIRHNNVFSKFPVVSFVYVLCTCLRWWLYGTFEFVSYNRVKCVVCGLLVEPGVVPVSLHSASVLKGKGDVSRRNSRNVPLRRVVLPCSGRSRGRQSDGGRETGGVCEPK